MFLNKSEDSLSFLLRIVVISMVRRKKKVILKKDYLSHRQPPQERLSRGCLIMQCAKSGFLSRGGRTAQRYWTVLTLAEFQSDKRF